MYLLVVLVLHFSKSLLMSIFLTVLVPINEVRPIYLKFFITHKRAIVINIGL